jgi:alpha-1,3-glucan synthase
MLSQFKKTIKKALKSTPKERQLLRARSAVQRFPVVEWRQRTEDFHKGVSTLAVESRDRTPGGRRTEICRGCYLSSMLEIGTRFTKETRSTGWDHESLMGSPGLRSANVSQENLAAGQPLLTPPGLPNRDSFASDMSADTTYRNSVASQQQYNTFLERANRQFAQQNQHAPDPFMEQGRTS